MLSNLTEPWTRSRTLKPSQRQRRRRSMMWIGPLQQRDEGRNRSDGPDVGQIVGG
jgi:hypothetical protein